MEASSRQVAWGIRHKSLLPLNGLGDPQPSAGGRGLGSFLEEPCDSGPSHTASTSFSQPDVVHQRRQQQLNEPASPFISFLRSVLPSSPLSLSSPSQPSAEGHRGGPFASAALYPDPSTAPAEAGELGATGGASAAAAHCRGLHQAGWTSAAAGGSVPSEQSLLHACVAAVADTAALHGPMVGASNQGGGLVLPTSLGTAAGALHGHAPHPAAALVDPAAPFALQPLMPPAALPAYDLGGLLAPQASSTYSAWTPATTARPAAGLPAAGFNTGPQQGPHFLRVMSAPALLAGPGQLLLPSTRALSAGGGVTKATKRKCKSQKMAQLEREVSLAAARNQELRALLQGLQQEKQDLARKLDGLGQQITLVRESNKHLQVNIQLSRDAAAALHSQLQAKI